MIYFKHVLLAFPYLELVHGLLQYASGLVLGFGTRASL